MNTTRTKASLGRMVIGCLALATGVSTSRAHDAGEVLWAVELADSVLVSEPTVGPDGRIHLHAGQLYAISPDGQIVWSRPLPDPKAVDVAADGTVYAGSDHTIFAFSPEGVELWTFTEPPGGQGLMAGPTVGPDGNIYAVTDGGGLGALSLTPEGDFRWNVPGFVNFDGTGLSRIPFADDRFYFGEDIVPGCDPDGLQEGAVAVTLDGVVDWCTPLSSVVRPMAAPNGRAYVRFSSRTLRAFEAGGEIGWTFALPIPSNSVTGPGVGPDNAAYLSRNIDEIWSIDGAGQLRWVATDPDSSNFQKRATVAFDNSAVVYGTGYSFGTNGTVYARDPADGSLLWTVPITGDTAGAAAPAAFSGDSQVVYVPTSTSTANFLMAIQVHDSPENAPGDLDGDGDVDLDDFGVFAACYNGANNPPAAACPPGVDADLDGDGDVDLEDFAIFAANFTG